MSAHSSQYHHYIPRFILKRFSYTYGISESPKQDDLLHFLDLPSGHFYVRGVKKTCGSQNLYYDENDSVPMRIEDLFSKLESQTSMIFAKITTAISNSLDHIDILEKDVHILFKFMNVSLRRSEQYRNEIRNPQRENDFMFQRLFEASDQSGRSSDPDQFWLSHLLYLLETSHEDLLTDAETGENVAADTYVHFIQRYTLQIWRAADGYEFFLNERLVDFEGDTQSFLGTEVKDTGSQLMWMTTEDLIHLVLPVSPEVAIIFCDESRCWESPFADMMHRLKKPYPQNSLLKNAPHKDIVNVHVPSERRGKKTWPATTAWRVNIGTLSRDHHRILASYSLSHATSFIVVRSRARFERAKRELEVFAKSRSELWARQGILFDYQDTSKQRGAEDEHTSPSQEQIQSIVDIHMSALEEVVNIINITQEPLERNKDNMLKSWLAIHALEVYRSTDFVTSTTTSSRFCIMHPAVKAAFEAAYPPQHPNHRDLVTLRFEQFFSRGLGEEIFAELTFKIDSKISELVRADAFHMQWEAFADKSRHPQGYLSQSDMNVNEEPAQPEENLLENPAFQSIVRAAQIFDVLRWMFEERQDILATFIQQIGVPVEDMQPSLIRIRSRRD